MFTLDQLSENLRKVIIGRDEVINKVIVGILSGGHLLIEDVPGVGKTTLAKAIALSFGGKFKRVQFTPDLLPSDITGITVYDLNDKKFKVVFGPIFTNFLLADEINRGTPKTQSALLEAMSEYTVTIDGVGYKLEAPFVVLATDNPIEYEGTFPLPEAQLDRFIMRFSIGYPDAENEEQILFKEKIVQPLDSLTSIGTIEDLIVLQNKVKEIFVHKSITEYIVSLASATRLHKDLYLGVSPRGSLALMRISQGWALLDGRDFVLPDDVKKSVFDVYNHRVILKADARLRGVKTSDVIEEIVEETKVPIEEKFSQQ
ncbi:MAG: AAA family ATPase [Caldisericaceae bacterium]